jgi:hypothetical protein
MNVILLFLSVLGGVALVVRLLRAILRFAFAAAQSSAAAGLAEVSARRGDLSTLAERKTVERAARQARRRDGLLAMLWLLLLVLPLLFGYAREAYAAAAVLWFLPLQPIPLPRQG